MTDVHIHIERGPYTKEWISRFADQAVKAGLDEIWLLEHSFRFREFAPMYEPVCAYNDYQKNWYLSRVGPSIGEYQALISEMRKQQFPVRIRWGLEICYLPGYESLIREQLRAFPYDFAVGSIHWVEGFGFDHKAEFWEGKDPEALYRSYYALMLQMVKTGLFSGVAHPDSIKCFHHYPTGDFSAVYRELADELNARGMYAEQSGGLALNYGFEERGMNRTMLDIFRSRNVAIRFASDAHRPEDVGANIAEMQSALLV